MLCYTTLGIQYKKVITDQQETPQGMRQEALLMFAGKLSLLMASTVEQDGLMAAWLGRKGRAWNLLRLSLCAKGPSDLGGSVCSSDTAP